MDDLASTIRDLLTAVRQTPPIYADIRKHCEAVRVRLLDPANSSAAAPDLSALLCELLARIRHPGSHWFIENRAWAAEHLERALAEVDDSWCGMPLEQFSPQHRLIIRFMRTRTSAPRDAFCRELWGDDEIHRGRIDRALNRFNEFISPLGHPHELHQRSNPAEIYWE